MNKKTLEKLFHTFNTLNVLIIGDVMIDAYLMGRVERISPEAPVPIVTVTKKENRLGGAANVALNVLALGANPILLSVTGNDENAQVFESLLKEKKLKTSGIIRSVRRVTTVKTRVIGSKLQMLRIDEETETGLVKEETLSLINRFREILKKEKIDVIIFEDYDKGVISEELIRAVTTDAMKKNIPVAVDPKKKNFMAYRNVTLFKPNLRELQNGIKTDADTNTLPQLKKAVSRFREQQKIDMALITLSEAGMLLSSKKKEAIIPAHLRSITDVSGAGDTVISVAALCLACRTEAIVMTELANLAGGLVCEMPGVVPVNKQQLLNEAVNHLCS